MGRAASEAHRRDAAGVGECMCPSPEIVSPGNSAQTHGPCSTFKHIIDSLKSTLKIENKDDQLTLHPLRKLPMANTVARTHLKVWLAESCSMANFR